MIESLITSKTRVKLLLKFFLNSDSTSYLRNLASEFGESSNAIRVELNRFEEAGLLKTNLSGNKKIYRANTSHPLYSDLNNIIRKYTGLDHIIEKIVKKLGDVEKVYVSGDIAQGMDSKIIDLIFTGTNLDKIFLMDLIEKAEKLIGRKIRFIIYEEKEFEKIAKKMNGHRFLLWQR
ncbi:MAG: ArsR family transcriptional regulator [Ignavibacteria bacterium]|nr:ArsR family transcriptional regulator [Ignavibacteria bacterium]